MAVRLWFSWSWTSTLVSGCAAGHRHGVSEALPLRHLDKLADTDAPSSGRQGLQGPIHCARPARRIAVGMRHPPLGSEGP